MICSSNGSYHITRTAVGKHSYKFNIREEKWITKEYMAN
jgi:hypothetical protein